ncbi:MAG: serine/threonine-protein kinase PknK [Candidatus Sericytochromatia bacterium]
MPSSTLHDRYDVIRPIAQGGMASVVLAREVDTGREVAMKLLVVPDGARPAEWTLRFQQEFHQTTRLRHPHVVATYDYATAHDGTPFYTMEYLPGPGLEELVPMEPDRLAGYVPGLLQALGAIHLQGLVHCDLKPENIRLAKDGSVRLMDLGLATRAGQMAPGVQGTLPYMPPEVIRRQPVDRRSDLYALGAVLYHLLAGEPPFSGDVRQVLKGHLEAAAPPLGEKNPRVPADLARFVHRLLEKDPMARFQSAGEALVALGAAGTVEDDATLFHAPVIGRDDELVMLRGALDRSKAGAYEEVWVHGDPDVGLEALVEEFCCQAQLSGATVIRGTFWARSAPFEGLRAMVRGLVALARPHAQALAPLLPILARIEPQLGAQAAPEHADPQQERLRLFDALAQLVRLASTSGPLLLAFANAHQASAAFREWLEYAGRNCQDLPVLVVNTFEGDPGLDLDPARWALELEPLGHAEIHKASQAILGQIEVPMAFSKALHQAAGGYPHRLDPLLRHMAESGALQREAGRWLLPETSIDGVLAGMDPAWAKEQRLKNLPALATSLLEALALMGRETELYVLWQMVRTPAGSAQLTMPPAATENGGELFEAMSALEAGGWVVNAQGRVQLGPEVDREALITRMGEAKRRQVHRQAAASLESLLAQAPSDTTLLAEVASHAMAAGDRKRGPRFALEAAKAQSRLFALEEAEELLRAALTLTDGDPHPDAQLQLDLVRLRADIARLAGDRRLAASSYDRAIAMAEASGDAEAQAALANGLGRLKMVTGELEAAEPLFRSVIDRLGATPHPEKAQALTQLGRLALTRGRLEEASRWIEQALAAARQGAHRALVRDNMAQLGYLYVAADDARSAEGLALLFDALQLTEKDEAKLELNAVYALLGNAQLLLGRFTEAKLAFQRNCDLCAEIGAAPHDEATALMRRAQVELELGDYSAARKSASPAGALARMIGNKLLLAQVRLIEGMAALYQGDFTIYQDATLLVEESLQGMDSGYLQAMYLTCRAEAEGYLGQWSSALSSANAALEEIAKGAGHEFAVRATMVKGDALTRLGLYKPARQALEAMAAPRNEALLARWLIARAQLERLDGHQREARQMAERALELARRAGAVPVAAVCGLLLARLAPNGDEALTWSRRALLDAEVCGQPALEAEALFLASRSASRVSEAEWFLEAALAAWRRAIAGLTPAIVDAFGQTEERRALKDALKRREAEGYRLDAEDHRALLALLAMPPAPRTFLPALLAFLKAGGRPDRLAVFWESEAGEPVLVVGEGSPYGAAQTAASELQSAKDAPGAIVVPLAVTPEGEAPWGAILVTGLAPDQADRLTKLTSHLPGALWACRQLWLATRQGATSAERRVPAAEPGIPLEFEA